MSKSKKLTKKQKLDFQQGILKAQLHSGCRLYHKYRQAQSLGYRTKVPVKLHALIKLQREINSIRKQIGKQPIEIIENLRATLLFL